MYGLHADLVRVLEVVAATAPKGMLLMVIEGLRSKEQMMINYGKGRTVQECVAKGVAAGYAKPSEKKVTWLNDPFNSMHAFGLAVDLGPVPLDWNNKKAFLAMAEHVLKAAKVCKVNLRWGKDWDQDGKYEEKGETDGPHFELVGYKK
jgi:peptidoglycan LD-endopeptidase CwlK